MCMCVFIVCFFCFFVRIFICVVICVFLCALLKLHNICVDVYGDLKIIHLIAHISSIFTFVLLFALVVPTKVGTIVFRMVVGVAHEEQREERSAEVGWQDIRRVLD